METHMSRCLVAVAAATLTIGLALAGCSSDKKSDTGGSGGTGAKAAKEAKSAADLGGQDKLVEAAKKEGALTIIAVPRDWANYGAIIDGFTAKYGIKINSDNPDGSSADEINAVKNTKGQDRAPDVLDIGLSFALSKANQELFAPYKVATWADIPDTQKDPDGKWFNDYGGYISIGCDSAKIAKCPTSIADLKDPAYKGKVALNGDPTKANAAFSAVYAAALANGGSFDDIKPGIAFFGGLKKSGNFIPVEAKPSTVETGETPIVLDWDYLNAGYVTEFAKKGIKWTTAVPSDVSYPNYYAQAISAFAPHPAAARLWQEYLYSDEGQNLWLKGFARPVRLVAMTKSGAADASAVKALPAVSGDPKFPSDDQVTAAKKAVTEGWANAVK
jgi:putative spermidine/putrescine transport system substrate-binding protein